jgi:hypothetical protein
VIGHFEIGQFVVRLAGGGRGDEYFGFRFDQIEVLMCIKMVLGKHVC